MIHFSRARLLLAATALGCAAPAFAQVDETNASSVPSCSASVTDHCVTRGRHGGGAMMMSHHGRHHHHGHHGHHHHHAM